MREKVGHRDSTKKLNETPFKKAEAVVQTWTAHFGSLDFGKFTAILRRADQGTGQQERKAS